MRKTIFSRCLVSQVCKENQSDVNHRKNSNSQCHLFYCRLCQTPKNLALFCGKFFKLNKLLAKKRRLKNIYIYCWTIKWKCTWDEVWIPKSTHFTCYDINIFFKLAPISPLKERLKQLLPPLKLVKIRVLGFFTISLCNARP